MKNDNTESDTEKETKQITFEGQTYTVTTWVGWAARGDDGGLYAYSCDPTNLQDKPVQYLIG